MWCEKNEFDSAIEKYIKQLKKILATDEVVIKIDPHDKEDWIDYSEKICPGYFTVYRKRSKKEMRKLKKHMTAHWKRYLSSGPESFESYMAKYYKDLELVSSFTLVQMPGNCGICISTRAHVIGGFENKGVGTVLNNMRKDIAKLMGYGLLLCTVKEDNAPQLKILSKNSWDKIYTTKNPRTNNKVSIHVVELY